VWVRLSLSEYDLAGREKGIPNLMSVVFQSCHPRRSVTEHTKEPLLKHIFVAQISPITMPRVQRVLDFLLLASRHQ
jgi:hypothetical protein